MTDIPQTNCILVAGSNVAECFPVMMQWLWRARDDGAKLIVMDPRETPTARTADMWLPLRPGTDVAILNAMLRFVIAESLADDEYIASRTRDWECGNPADRLHALRIPLAPCAQVCRVMAILITPEGVVQQADASRCIACRNCVYACPFGVPKIDLSARLMKKCNLCYDRTSQGLQPWCAQTCPTDALWYGTYEQFANERQGKPVRHTQFGTQEVRTRVYHVLPAEESKLQVFEDADGVTRSGEGAQGEEPWVL